MNVFPRDIVRPRLCRRTYIIIIMGDERDGNEFIDLRSVSIDYYMIVYIYCRLYIVLSS